MSAMRGHIRRPAALLWYSHRGRFEFPLPWNRGMLMEKMGSYQG